MALAYILSERNICYQLQYRKCGKQNKHKCQKCIRGPGYGPYYHAYRRQGSHMHTTYVGKVLPEGIATSEPALQDAGEPTQPPTSTDTVEAIPANAYGPYSDVNSLSLPIILNTLPVLPGEEVQA